MLEDRITARSASEGNAGRAPLASRFGLTSAPINSVFRQSLLIAILALAAATAWAAGPSGEDSARDAIVQAQAKMVKIYGAGGLGGLESCQSGVLISDTGHILTVFSHVLDTDYISATLFDGRRFEAKLLGADPRLDVAVLKIDAKSLPHFDLRRAAAVEEGARVLAMSNLFGVATGNEPVSVQHGTVSVVTRLDARRGIFETPYHGPVYVLDVVCNNPGAAGGALVTRRGELAAMLGKELRNSLNNTWLNYAVPIDQLRASAEAICAGSLSPRRSRSRLSASGRWTLAAAGRRPGAGRAGADAGLRRPGAARLGGRPRRPPPRRSDPAGQRPPDAILQGGAERTRLDRLRRPRFPDACSAAGVVGTCLGAVRRGEADNAMIDPHSAPSCATACRKQCMTIRLRPTLLAASSGTRLDYGPWW